MCYVSDGNTALHCQLNISFQLVQQVPFHSRILAVSPIQTYLFSLCAVSIVTRLMHSKFLSSTFIANGPDIANSLPARLSVSSNISNAPWTDGFEE